MAPSCWLPWERRWSSASTGSMREREKGWNTWIHRPIPRWPLPRNQLSPLLRPSHQVAEVEAREVRGEAAEEKHEKAEVERVLGVVAKEVEAEVAGAITKCRCPSWVTASKTMGSNAPSASRRSPTRPTSTGTTSPFTRIEGPTSAMSAARNSNGKTTWCPTSVRSTGPAKKDTPFSEMCPQCPRVYRGKCRTCKNNSCNSCNKLTKSNT